MTGGPGSVGSRPSALRLAHRGDHRSQPENTIAAFRAALARPACGGLELDVRSSADGIAVVLHDATLERVHGRPEACATLTAEELAGLGVPTLDDVLAVCPPSAFLDVELKEDLGAIVVGSLARARGQPGGTLGRAVISSFEDGVVATIRRLAPGWATWLNAVDLEPATVARALDLGCRGVAAHWRAVTPRSVARTREAGLELAAWTVRRRPTYARLERLGVVAVCVEGSLLDG